MSAKPRSRAALNKGFATTAMGSLMLGICGNALWSKILDPGVSWVTTIIFAVGAPSTAIEELTRDAIFELTSQDPVGLFGGLTMVIAGLMAMGCIPVVLVYACFGKHWFAGQLSSAWRFLFHTESVATNLRQINEEPLESGTWRLFVYVTKLIVYVSFAYFLCSIALAFGVVGQAILIRSSIESDLISCAPYISSDERMQFASDFSQVSSEAAFRKVLADLEVIAKDNGIWLKTPTMLPSPLDKGPPPKTH